MFNYLSKLFLHISRTISVFGVECALWVASAETSIAVGDRGCGLVFTCVRGCARSWSLERVDQISSRLSCYVEGGVTTVPHILVLRAGSSSLEILAAGHCSHATSTAQLRNPPSTSNSTSIAPLLIERNVHRTVVYLAVYVNDYLLSSWHLLTWRR